MGGRSLSAAEACGRQKAVSLWAANACGRQKPKPARQKPGRQTAEAWAAEAWAAEAWAAEAWAAEAWAAEALSFEVSDALPTALEKPNDRFICTPDRTHNRIRSPR